MNTRLDTKPSSVEPDWAAIRSRFPVLEKKTYLNSCAYGALATDVIAALQKYINDRLEKGTDWNYWVARNESVRTAVADFLGADTDEWLYRMMPNDTAP
jgi:selenocysteine lyase/cysteine desulfurase